jgi:hypothetical protein
MWKCEKYLYRRKLRDLGDISVEKFVTVETSSHSESSLASGHSIICLTGAALAENRVWRPLPSLCCSGGWWNLEFIIL